MEGDTLGWFLGDETFLKELMGRIDGVMAEKQCSSSSGEQVRGYDLVEAEHLVQLGLATLGLTDDEFDEMRKNCEEKYAIAWLVRRNTRVKNQWIRDRLKMESHKLFDFPSNEWNRGGRGGDEFFEQIKNIKS